MAFDFNEAREIVEAAKKRGLIRAQGEEAPRPPDQKKEAASTAHLPDWLQDGLSRPAPPASAE
jgi:hypothetical protein